jgi:gamma-glutamyltranspeptidase/glutathione hydrolase
VIAFRRLLAGERYLTQPRARAYFYTEDGKPVAVGTMLRNPAYARTLRKIATEGADAFYAGEIARDIVDTANSHPTNPGDLTLADLAGYTVKVRTPVCDSYRRYRVCGFPLPSSGGITVLQMLKILEPYDLKAMGPASFWSVHFNEAGRPYADRGVYGDPDYYSRPPACSTPPPAQPFRLIRTDAVLAAPNRGSPPSVAPAEGRA